MSLWSAWSNLVTYGGDTPAPAADVASNEEKTRIATEAAQKTDTLYLMGGAAVAGLVLGIWLMKR